MAEKRDKEENYKKMNASEEDEDVEEQENDEMEYGRANNGGKQNWEKEEKWRNRKGKIKGNLEEKEETNIVECETAKKEKKLWNYGRKKSNDRKFREI